MNALTKSLAAAAILTGAFLSAPAQALPSCATSIGMTITPPGGTTQSPDTGGCLDIAPPTYTGYNWAYSGYTPDEQLAFRQILADIWGGTADDWVYLREIDGRSDSISDGVFSSLPDSDPNALDAADLWTNGQMTPGATGASGSFSVTITETPLGNAFVPKLMDIVGVLKPDSVTNPGNKSQRGTFEDTVLAYLFSDIQISQRGDLTGTFDLRSSTTAGTDYVTAGIGLFGRVASAVNPTPIPEPGILALIGIAALGASVARRKRSA
jgi:hypothetical protein